MTGLPAADAFDDAAVQFGMRSLEKLLITRRRNTLKCWLVDCDGNAFGQRRRAAHAGLQQLPVRGESGSTEAVGHGEWTVEFAN